MSFQSLIAHNGIIHQKSNVVDKQNPSTSGPESKSTSEKQILEATESKTETLLYSCSNYVFANIPNGNYGLTISGGSHYRQKCRLSLAFGITSGQIRNY